MRADIDGAAGGCGSCSYAAVLEALDEPRPRLLECLDRLVNPSHPAGEIPQAGVIVGRGGQACCAMISIERSVEISQHFEGFAPPGLWRRPVRDLRDRDVERLDRTPRILVEKRATAPIIEHSGTAGYPVRRPAEDLRGDAERTARDDTPRQDYGNYDRD